MNICWLIPDDHGGGVISVALSCCRQAAKAGHTATLLTVLELSGWLTSDEDFCTTSLGLSGAAQETPEALLKWLAENPQDVLFLNGCEQADIVIPYIPLDIKCIYVVHDTAPRYWNTALREEDNLQAIIAVSQVVADQFKYRLKSMEKLFVINNGCAFAEPPAQNKLRHNDLIFLGGDNLYKGAYDVLKVWKLLHKLGFEGKLHWFGNIKRGFQSQIDKLPNSDQIIVYGRVKREIIFSTCERAKVVLVLSRSESFGIATIEAMSMGCVPITWDIETGTKEIVIANENGLYAKLGDYQGLTQQVLKACKNYYVFETPVMESVRSRFDESTMWKNYQFLIDKLVKQKTIMRSRSGQKPGKYVPTTRHFQLLPSALRSSIREIVGRNPYFGYWLRDLRGF